MRLAAGLSLLSLALLVSISNAYAQSPREQLRQLAEQLQKSPGDNALRERIVKLGAQIKPAPAVPEDARRAFVRANTTMSDAKGADDYGRAVQLYREASLIAPWWGDPYFNLSKAQELRQDFSDAIAALRLFILSAPPADDLRKALDYVYALEERRDRGAKEGDAKRQEQGREPALLSKVSCPWQNGDGSTMITVDYGSASLTYVDLFADGRDSPAIVSKANITETNISWTQTEPWLDQGRHVVSYNLSRISGDLNYSFNYNGRPGANRRNCVMAKPRF